MSWELFWVAATFGLYIFIAWRSRVKSTEGFYVAGHGVPALANGMATGADWMSAASFLGMAGLIAFQGYNASAYLMGWTGGYVLLALLLAPYLRKYGAYTVPDFVGDRYYSQVARVVALLCAIFVSLTYIAGQMRGVGIVFARFLDLPIAWGVIIGVGIVFVYATLGGMKGITWTQVAQYCVLILAYVIPAIAISYQFTGNPVPQLGLGATVQEGQLGVEPGTTMYLLDQIDKTITDLGFSKDYTSVPGEDGAMLNLFLLTFTLMVGTAGLPHVIIRFYTTKSVQAARWSAFWAILFIAILYTSAPAVAVFARANLIHTVHEQPYETLPSWFKNYESNGLIGWIDKNGDGKVQLAEGSAMSLVGKAPQYQSNDDGSSVLGAHGQRSIDPASASSNANELHVDRDIMVLANPEIANLPKWVIGLVVAGGLAAALSTAAGLLLVISSSVSHDLMKRTLNPDMTEKQEMKWARIAAGGAVVIAGYFGIDPPGFVAQTVAFAFGLAAASFFPVLVLGIFSLRVNKEGAIAGMVVGILFTGSYIIYNTFLVQKFGFEPMLLAGIKPTGIGTIGMLLNLTVTLIVSRVTPPPPEEVQQSVLATRSPSGKDPGPAHH